MPNCQTICTYIIRSVMDTA